MCVPFTELKGLRGGGCFRLSFYYELDLIAWLIGGAVGFSAAMSGVKGQAAGVVCGVLVLLSILGGINKHDYGLRVHSGCIVRVSQ